MRMSRVLAKLVVAVAVAFILGGMVVLLGAAMTAGIACGLPQANYRPT
jgi:hypothetical protein